MRWSSLRFDCSLSRAGHFLSVSGGNLVYDGEKVAPRPHPARSTSPAPTPPGSTMERTSATMVGTSMGMSGRQSLTRLEWMLYNLVLPRWLVLGVTW